MESKLIEWEDAAALGDTDASGEFLGRQGRPRRNPAQGAQPWSIHAKPRWTRIGGANDSQPKTRKAPAAKRAASKTGAKAAAAGIRDPVFALIDTHKARTKEWCRLYNKLDVTQFQAEETHEKPLTGRAKCVMRPGQGQESTKPGRKPSRNE